MKDLAYLLVGLAISLFIIAVCAVVSIAFGVFLLFDTMDPAKFSMWMG